MILLDMNRQILVFPEMRMVCLYTRLTCDIAVWIVLIVIILPCSIVHLVLAVVCPLYQLDWVYIFNNMVWLEIDDDAIIVDNAPFAATVASVTP
jgi:general stress protein CsbA